MATARISKHSTGASLVSTLPSKRGSAVQTTQTRRVAARSKHDHVAHALVRTAAAFKRLTTQRMKDEFAITGIQAEILMLLATEPSMLGNDLAAVVGVNASTISHALDALEQRQLLTRRRCTDDRRVVRIALTDQAKRIARRTIAITQHILDALTAGISHSDLQALQRGLRRMVDNCRADAGPSPRSGRSRKS
ncbi:MarR family winged helix-turn-helix transcriptional regulator [Dyella acidiphila]|uniref:Winged helix-turn-helix transcriptional regulator n=1 Tax=Dyella acidiphila TaxID=2775866 RepID=A0ABR9G9Y7_9GAMM|nr:MarR family winged helix-turn-helix transcriptional regulator [Dyella acidiphila]MBE1160842.1 winged helix-turn-helix transcriptional regulator [Dyella acidiphila]